MSCANDHCFTGSGREFWRLTAQGFQGAQIRRDGGVDVDEEIVDIRALALRNGGIERPREVKLRAGLFYYRFLGTAAHNVGVAATGSLAYFGHWWIDGETMAGLRRFARDGGYPISEAAKYLLALPFEWGDHRRLVRALLESPLRAWEGKGAPAQASSRHPSDRGTKWIPPQHITVHQLFIPGRREELRGAFTQWTCDYADR